MIIPSHDTLLLLIVEQDQASREFVLTYRAARSKIQYALSTSSLSIGCYHFSTRSSNEHDITNTLACRVKELEVFFAVVTFRMNCRLVTTRLASELSLRTISFSSDAAFMPLDALMDGIRYIFLSSVK